MSKRFLRSACLVLVGGALVIALFHWWPRADEASAVVTPDDLVKARQRLQGDMQEPPAEAAPMEMSQKVRLAVGSLGIPDDHSNREMVDLVMANLAGGAAGLEMVERQSLDKVLSELSLGLSGLTRAKEALAIGRLLRADWFLLGTQAKLGSTNAIVLRLVDARTGILRDAGIVRAGDSVALTASDIAGFVRRSRQTAATATPRIYLAIGTFEDLSLNNRLAGLPAQLRGSLIAAYRTSNVTLLEREYVDYLLQEVRLDLAGLTQDAETNAPQRMQSGFWVVSGQYRSYETTNAQVELVLDIVHVFGTGTRVRCKASPPELLAGEIQQAIAGVMGRSKGVSLAPTRRSEANEQLGVGKEIVQGSVRNGEYGLIQNDFGSSVEEWQALQQNDASVIKRKRNLEEAIRAFEIVLLLEPGSHEARMYLATCLRDAAISRPEEARSYYREIIEDMVQDRWSELAQKALVASFDRFKPAEAASWFGAAASQTTNPFAARFYDEQAKVAQATYAIASGDRAKAQEVAEKRLFEGIQDFKATTLLGKPPTHSNFGDDYGYLMGMFQYMKVFGSDRSAAAQNLAALLPQMKSQAPELEPYLLATVVSFQVSTNVPVITEFERNLDACMEQPEKIFQPEKFWGYVQWLVCQWCFEQTNFALAVKLMEGERRAGGEGHAKFDDDAKLQLAYAYLGTERWKDALDLFEGFGNQSVNAPGIAGPWGRARTMIRTDQMAAYCRRNLRMPSVGDPRRFEMGPNCVCMHTPSTFTTYKDGLWLAIAGQLIRLDYGLRTNLVESLPIGADVPINCLALGRDAIWLGTVGGGLIEYRRSSRQCHRLTVPNGLLMDDVSGLHETDGVLWIGYGGMSGGGFGKLDLHSRKLTSFMRSMFSNLAESPPRGPVVSIVTGNSGDLFMYADATIREFHPDQGSWGTAPRKPGELLYCFAADRDRVMEGVEVLETEIELDTGSTPLGTNQNTRVKFVLSDEQCSALEAEIKTNGRGWRITGRSVGTAKSKAAVEAYDFNTSRWSSVVDADALPNTPSTLSLDGCEVWAAGKGFIARINLNQNKVTAFCRVPAESVERIQIGGGYVWAQYDRHLHRALIGALP